MYPSIEDQPVLSEKKGMLKVSFAQRARDKNVHANGILTLPQYFINIKAEGMKASSTLFGFVALFGFNSCCVQRINAKHQSQRFTLSSVESDKM